MNLRGPFWIIVLAWLCLGADLAHAAVGEGKYRLPLIGPYAVYQQDPGSNASQHWGRYQLVRMSPRSDSGFSFVLPKLERVVVVGTAILGKTEEGHFILDTRSDDATPQLFESLEQWQSALAAMGISGDVQLRHPNEMAARLPQRVLRPWEFRVMKGLLGYSDGVWSLIVQLSGLVVSFFLGLMKSKRLPLMLAIGIGIIVNIVGQLYIAGGRPGAFVGFVGLPLLCCLAALVGRAIRGGGGRNPVEDFGDS